MKNSILKIIRGIVRLRGAAGTLIGNVADALKVHVVSGALNPVWIEFQEYHHGPFGRFRTTQAETLFFHSFVYTPAGEEEDYWSYAITGSASRTLNNPNSSLKLSTTTAINDEINYRSRRRIEYIEGKGQVVKITHNFDGAVAGVNKEIYLGDDNNGIIFRLEGTTPKFILRSDVSGSVVETEFAPGGVGDLAWDDPLDGTGDSGIEMLWDKQNFLYIDYAWQGTGSIRMGFLIGRELYIAKTYTPANTGTAPWCKSGNLPVGFRIKNTTAQAAARNMHITCIAIESEGGTNELGVLQDISTEKTPVTSTSTDYIALAGIRIDTDYKYSSIKPVEFVLHPISGNATLHWKVVVNGTLASPTWADIDGIAEGLTNNPVYTNGTGKVLDQGYIDLASGKGSDKANAGGTVTVKSDLYLGFDITDIADTLTLVASTTSGSGDVLFKGKYREFY